MRPLHLSAVIMTVLSAIPMAVPAASETTPGLPAGATGTGVVLEMAAVLILVVLLIIGLGWLMKRVGHFPAAGKGMVRILGGVSLGPREKAVILEAGNKRLLVGVAPGRVQTLCLLDEFDAEHDLSIEESPTEFSAQLNAQLQEEPK